MKLKRSLLQASDKTSDSAPSQNRIRVATTEVAKSDPCNG